KRTAQRPAPATGSAGDALAVLKEGMQYSKVHQARALSRDAWEEASRPLSAKRLGERPRDLDLDGPRLRRSCPRDKVADSRMCLGRPYCKQPIMAWFARHEAELQAELPRADFLRLKFHKLKEVEKRL